LLTDLAALAAIVELTYETRAALIDGQLGDPVFPEAVQVVRIGPSAEQARDFAVAIAPYDGGNLAIVDGGEAIDVVGDWSPGDRLLVANMDGRSRIVQVAKQGRMWILTTRGAAHRVVVVPRHIAQLAKHMIEKIPPDLSRFLLAPMPGLLTRLEVKAGDKVEPGQPVAVVEAMKMENILRATKSTTVKATPAKAGDSLAVDQVIVEFE
jgi:propionyl-CoA carboxylase alpha chain